MPIETEERAKAQSEGPEGGDRIAPMRADDHSNANPAVETPVEARQGFLGKPVLMVLVGGLVLVIIAWIALQIFAS